MGISKTDFMRGMQCPRMLWLDKHRPSLRVIPPETQIRLNAGNDFGDRAMGMFGPYEEMTVYRPGTKVPDRKKMVEKTREHLLMGTEVICEAAFMDEAGNYCAADILRFDAERGCYDLYEVKNSPEVREQFVKDAAFQWYIIGRCGVSIGKVFIVIHGPDEDDPFVPVEVTEKARPYIKWVADHIWDLNRQWKQKEELMTPPGPQCDEPYPCWYFDHCHGSGPSLMDFMADDRKEGDA